MALMMIMKMMMMSTLALDFDAFSPEHSQYLAFSFDGDGLGDKGSLSLDRFSMYIFFYSIHVFMLVTEAYD